MKHYDVNNDEMIEKKKKVDPKDDKEPMLREDIVYNDKNDELLKDITTERPLKS